MSKSVTIIRGAVWTQRSVTWNRNSTSKLGSRGAPDADGQPNLRRTRRDASKPNDRADEPEKWDDIYDGRNFKRCTKTL